MHYFQYIHYNYSTRHYDKNLLNVLYPHPEPPSLLSTILDHF